MCVKERLKYSREMVVGEEQMNKKKLGRTEVNA